MIENVSENVEFTKSIDPEIISMILPKHLNLARITSKRVTVQEKEEFDAFTRSILRSERDTEGLTEGNGDGND